MKRLKEEDIKALIVKKSKGKKPWGETPYHEILILFLGNEIKVGNDCYYEFIEKEG